MGQRKYRIVNIVIGDLESFAYRANHTGNCPMSYYRAFGLTRGARSVANAIWGIFVWIEEFLYRFLAIVNNLAES